MPNGDGKVSPRAFTCSDGSGRVSERVTVENGGTPRTRTTAMPAWWANSGSKRERTARKSSGYIPARLPVLELLLRVVGAQIGDRGLEVLQGVERLVDAGEAQERD